MRACASATCAGRRRLATERPRSGYRRLHLLLRRKGILVNHKRVHRLYRLEGLSVRVKRRRRQAAAPREVPPLPSSPMQRWSMDFVFDATADGSRFRVLTIVDRPGTSSGQTHRSRPQDSVCIGACA